MNSIALKVLCKLACSITFIFLHISQAYSQGSWGYRVFRKVLLCVFFLVVFHRLLSWLNWEGGGARGRLYRGPVETASLSQRVWSGKRLGCESYSFSRFLDQWRQCLLSCFIGGDYGSLGGSYLDKPDFNVALQSCSAAFGSSQRLFWDFELTGEWPIESGVDQCLEKRRFGLADE